MATAPASARAIARRAAVLGELAAVRASLRGPGGGDPALLAALSEDDDMVEMAAAVYAMPEQFRELGARTGRPLMWPWPASLFLGDAGRRQQLLLAAALCLAAVERRDAAAEMPPALTLVSGVGQK